MSEESEDLVKKAESAFAEIRALEGEPSAAKIAVILNILQEERDRCAGVAFIVGQSVCYVGYEEQEASAAYAACIEIERDIKYPQPPHVAVETARDAYDDLPF